MVRDGGYLREVSWERALSEAWAALEKAGQRRRRLRERADHERGGLPRPAADARRPRLPHVDSRARRGARPRARPRGSRVPTSAPRVSDIDHAGAILVLGTELVDEAPILDLRVRKAVRRNGARLVTISARPSTLDANATAAVRCAPGARRRRWARWPRRSALRAPEDRSTSWPRARAPPPASAPAPARRLRPGTERSGRRGARGRGGAARRGRRGDPLERAPVGGGARRRRRVEALLALAGALGLADRPESGLIGIPASTNGRGLREVGCLPGVGSRAWPRRSVRRSRTTPKALLLVDAPERARRRCSSGPASVIAFARYRSEALEHHANVVFPAEIYAEKEGTVTHPDGRVQRVRADARACRRGARRLVGARPSCARSRARAWTHWPRPRSPPRSPARCRSTPGSTSRRSAAWACAGRTGMPPRGCPGGALRGAAGRPARARPTAFASSPPRRSGRVTRWSTPASLALPAQAAHAEMSPDDARRLGVEHGQDVS